MNEWDSIHVCMQVDTCMQVDKKDMSDQTLGLLLHFDMHDCYVELTCNVYYTGSSREVCCDLYKKDIVQLTAQVSLLQLSCQPLYTALLQQNDHQ